MIVRIIAFLLWLCILAQPALSQDKTEEAFSEGFIFKWSAEVIFPMGIRFTASFLRPVSDIQSVNLTIRPEGESPITQAIPLDKPVNEGEYFTDLAYVWEIPADSSPRLFRDVNFEWTATDTQVQ